MTAKIKLLKLDELSDGTQRFQSQLLVGKNVADFIMSNDGVMKCYGKGVNGFGFYPYHGEYEIVSNKNEILKQNL